MKPRSLAVKKAPGTDAARVKTYRIGGKGVVIRPATVGEIEAMERRRAMFAESRGGTPAPVPVGDEVSPALAFLRELEGDGAESPDYEPYQLGSLDVFIARLSGAEIQQFSALCARNKFGQLDLASGEEVTSLVRAVLFLCVRKNQGDAKFFDLVSAWAYADNRKPRVVPLVAALFDKCCAVNPLLISDPETVSTIIRQEKKDAAPPENAPPPTT